MSDYSTEAMTSKEPPKTCGNCAHYFNVRPSMRQGMCPLDELDASGCAPIHNECDLACWKWAVKPLTFEQRYQQLEQVAKEMLHVIYSSWEEAEPVSKHSMKEALATMNELGVSLDD